MINISPGFPTPEFPNYDDVTLNRPVNADRAPSAADWRQMVSEVLAHQEVLQTTDYITPINTFGDGIHDDTAALKTAIATGRNVVLDPTKTYLTSGTLMLQTGQTFDGRGATLKNADQKLSTVVSPSTIVDGATSVITVAAGHTFVVGDEINLLVDSATFYTTIPRVITNVYKNQITVSGAFTTSGGFTLSGTIHVYTSWYQVAGSLTGFNTIRNVNFYGGRSQWTYAHWETTHGVVLYGEYNCVENCTLQELPGEGIISFGSHNTVRRNYIKNLGGNGVHFSGGDHVMVEGNTIMGCVKNLNVGHSHGGLSWSSLCDKTVVIGNYFSGNALSGLQGQAANDESNTRIMNNTFVDNLGADIQFVTNNSSSGPAKCLISGNYCKGSFAGIGISSGFSVGATDFIITQNHITMSSAGIGFGISIGGNATNTIISNNNIDMRSQTAPNVAIRANAVTSLTVSNNMVRGGSYGILVDGTTSKFVNITGNTFSEQTTSGIRHSVISATDVVIANNIIWNLASTTLNGYIGITATEPSLVQGNFVRVDSNAGAITSTKGITCGTAVATSRGLVVQCNQIRGNPSIGIQVTGGSALVVVQFNILSTSAVLTNSSGVVVTPASITYTGAITGGVLDTGTGAVNIASGGTGYVATVGIAFVDGTNSSATGTVTITGGVITAVNITSGGSGYVGTPVVKVGGTFLNGNFTLATTF